MVTRVEGILGCIGNEAISVEEGNAASLEQMSMFQALISPGPRRFESIVQLPLLSIDKISSTSI